MSAPSKTVVSTWAPLRIGVFRALWLAVLVSNVAIWMQTVGAQWLLVSQPHASILVALVQTADCLFRDGEAPHRFVELYAVPSWAEHLRQHADRLTATDQQYEEAAEAFSDRPETSHLIAVDLPDYEL